MQCSHSWTITREQLTSFLVSLRPQLLRCDCVACGSILIVKHKSSTSFTINLTHSNGTFAVSLKKVSVYVTSIGAAHGISKLCSMIAWGYPLSDVVVDLQSIDQLSKRWRLTLPPAQ